MIRLLKEVWIDKKKVWKGKKKFGKKRKKFDKVITPTTRIKEQLNGKCFYESEGYFYCFKDNLIVPVKKSNYPKVEDCK